MSMTSTEPTFIDLYSVGLVMADEIDDFVDRWHHRQSEPGIPVVPLHEFLGMSTDEYEAWVHDASALPHIVRARRSGMSVDDVMRECLDDMLLAARSADTSKIPHIRAWLEQRKKA